MIVYNKYGKALKLIKYNGIICIDSLDQLGMLKMKSTKRLGS